MHIIHLRKPIELFWLLLTALARSTWSAADGTVGTNYPDSSSSSFFLFFLPVRWLHLITVAAGEKLIIKMYRSRLCAYNCTTGG